MSKPLLSQRVTFGVVPIAEGPEARLYLGDLCDALGDLASVRVLPHRAPSPAALASAVVSGRVQAAWLSPTLLVSETALASVIPVVSSVREGAAAYHSALFCDEACAIRRPEQLAGAAVGWVARTSAAGYLLPRIGLAERGLDPSRLFSRESFLDSHGAVASAVFDGAVDVGATFAVFDSGDSSRALVRAGFQAPGRRAHVIMVTGPIPSDVIAVTAGVAPETRERLTSAFEAVANRPATKLLVRQLFGADGFARFSDTSLGALERIVEAGRRLERAAQT